MKALERKTLKTVEAMMNEQVEVLDNSYTSEWCSTYDYTVRSNNASIRIYYNNTYNVISIDDCDYTNKMYNVEAMVNQLNTRLGIA